MKWPGKKGHYRRVPGFRTGCSDLLAPERLSLNLYGKEKFTSNLLKSLLVGLSGLQGAGTPDPGHPGSEGCCTRGWRSRQGRALTSQPAAPNAVYPWRLLVAHAAFLVTVTVGTWHHSTLGLEVTDPWLDLHPGQFDFRWLADFYPLNLQCFLLLPHNTALQECSGLLSTLRD